MITALLLLIVVLLALILTFLLMGREDFVELFRLIWYVSVPIGLILFFIAIMALGLFYLRTHGHYLPQQP